MRAFGLAVAMLCAALSGWYLGGLAVAAEDGPPPVYDHQVAYLLASLPVPPENQEYFMFDLNPADDADGQAKQLAEAFFTADKEKKCLGLIGANPAHNQQVLTQAVAASSGKSFPDLRLIVVGPPQARQSVTRIAAPLGADLKYFAYP